MKCSVPIRERMREIFIADMEVSPRYIVRWKKKKESTEERALHIISM